MKKAFLILIQTFTLSVALCYGQVKDVNNHTFAQLKSQCTLFIDEATGTNFSYSFDTSTTGAIELTKGIEVSALLLNNSEDTLKYAYCLRWNPIFITTDNIGQLIVADEPNAKFDNPQLILILPHRYELLTLMMTYIKPQQKDFKFKIGFHLLKWNDKFKTIPPDTAAIKNADMIWSEEETMKVDSNRTLMLTTPEGLLTRAKIVYDTLSADDYKNYTLKSEINSLKSKKSVYRNERYCFKDDRIYFDIPVRFTNSSNDTLSYCNMVKTGSWTTIYTTDNPKIEVPAICAADREFETIEQIPPHHDTLFFIPVCCNTAQIKRGTRFRVGMAVLKCNTSSQFSEIWDYSKILAGLQKYTIWSDEVEVPLDK